MWRFAGRSEYLAITGGSIKDVKVARKAWVWPTQKYVRFRVSEVDYAFEVLAISAEKLPSSSPPSSPSGPASPTARASSSMPSTLPSASSPRATSRSSSRASSSARSARSPPPP
ncbi:uncharacterized protein J3R85_000676 [Psidium guajava]|nr:uncharacterized protein J3R85_000676 [Psidium guajava]